jgi:hypothetical protein
VERAAERVELLEAQEERDLAGVEIGVLVPSSPRRRCSVRGLIRISWATFSTLGRSPVIRRLSAARTSSATERDVRLSASADSSDGTSIASTSAFRVTKGRASSASSNTSWSTGASKWIGQPNACSSIRASARRRASSTRTGVTGAPRPFAANVVSEANVVSTSIIGSASSTWSQ